MNNQTNNVSIAGAGVINGGEYNTVKCSGAVKINGNIKCNNFSCSGSAKAEGDIICTEILKASGGVKISGALKADKIHLAGAIKSQSSIDAREIHASGALSADGDCSAENVYINGSLKIKGLLNAENIEITLEGTNGSDSSVSSIGGSSLKIKSRSASHWFSKKLKATLITDTIEADKVELEHTKAKTVRTIDALIGEGCEIDVLEYSGSAQISNKATVKQKVKI